MPDEREKGQWAQTADEGIVPSEPEDGDEGAPEELGSSVVGEVTGDDEPATEEGIAADAGDHADATSDGGAEPPAGAEPDLKDAQAAANRPD
jgi:hypothetical protein